MTCKLPREGDLYATVRLHGHTFELRYGYYVEADRARGEPVVVYPDLKNRPVYTGEGVLLVTAVQSPCPRYTVPDENAPEDCCSDCLYYEDARQEIARCLCDDNRQKI